MRKGYWGSLLTGLSLFSLGLFSLGMMSRYQTGEIFPQAWAEPAVGVAPPAIYPARTWQGRSQSVIRILNRVDSRVATLTLAVGEKVQYRGLTLTAGACLERPPTLPHDVATYLTIEEMRPLGSIVPSDEANGDNKAQNIFNGWFLLKEPALGGYTSPLYTISVVSCQGEATAPMAGKLPTPSVPNLDALTSSQSTVSHISGGEDDFSRIGKDAPATSSSGSSPLPPPVPSRQNRLSNSNNGQDFQEDWMQDSGRN